MSNEIKINHQKSIKKRDLTREKEDLKFEIPQSFKRKENKVEEGEQFFSKKRKTEVKAPQNLGDFSHTMSRRKTRVHHLTKKSFRIYGKKKSIRKRKNANRHN